MAKVQTVTAEDLERRDLIDITEVVDPSDLTGELADEEFARVESVRDVDRWHVSVETNVGTFEVTRETEFTYGGVAEEVQ